MQKKINLPNAKAEIARPKKIRDINRQIVLNYIRDRSPISRADIARLTALQRSTVSSIVDALEASELIEDIGEGDSTGGRKPTLLRIKRGTAAAIGVDVTPRVTTIAVADLAGRVLEKESFETNSDANYMTLRIIEGVRKFSEKNAGCGLEVGITLPGITDNALGTARYIPYFKWRNWEIGKKVSKATGLTVTIDNDANAIALAELWFGREKISNTRNFISVMVADGVGTGIVFDGQIYRGEKGAAGEFGHMIVGERGPVACSCGGYSCWEAFASEKSLKARYNSHLNGKGNNGGLISMDDLIKLANEGDKAAIAAFKETADYLGIGISNLIVGFSPQAIVVSGNITKAWHLVYESLHDAVEKSIRRSVSKITIRASSIDGNPALMGAISLVLSRKFSSAS